MINVGGALTKRVDPQNSNDGDGKVDREDSGCIIKGSYVPLKDSEDPITPLAECAQGNCS